MPQPSKEPCKKNACDIQACLSKNNFDPRKAIDKLRGKELREDLSKPRIEFVIPHSIKAKPPPDCSHPIEEPSLDFLNLFSKGSDAPGLGQDSRARHRKSLGIGFALMECPSYSMPRGAGLLRFVTRCLKAIELLQSCCEKCNYNSTHCASVSDLLKQSRRQTRTPTFS
ncbi:hypothetical protein RHGRI_032177 [Rhododendron griersonianum]|uniref:Uncharacterized protein n=1 Tax=Rhododendron griersonianum TaxID=479676 RepID=A0AAV6IBA7_9ERIC|nr:hypothetical protein RHGRI_032177 [Rhododendron griersonianum]